MSVSEKVITTVIPIVTRPRTMIAGMMMFWVMTQCRLVDDDDDDDYDYDGDKIFLRNVGIYLRVYTA
jgi:hypothetical protein